MFTIVNEETHRMVEHPTQGREAFSKVRRPAGKERDVLNGETSLSTTKHIEQ